MSTVRLIGFRYIQKGSFIAVCIFFCGRRGEGAGRGADFALLGRLTQVARSAGHQLAAAAGLTTEASLLANGTYRLVVNREVLPTHSSISDRANQVSRVGSGWVGLGWVEYQKNKVTRTKSFFSSFLTGNDTASTRLLSVLTLARIIKSVVTGQAPVTLELRNTPGKKLGNRRRGQLALSLPRGPKDTPAINSAELRIKLS